MAIETTALHTTLSALSLLGLWALHGPVLPCHALWPSQGTRVTQFLALAELVGEIAAACQKTVFANPTEERLERSSILHVFFVVLEHLLGLLLCHVWANPPRNEDRNLHSHVILGDERDLGCRAIR